MKVKIPDELKKDVPDNRWGKVLTVTPVVMTVVATLLAGLASSEMTKAQYDRALGAQLQSKAGDQWGYFQSKKLRSAMQRNSLDVLQATLDSGKLDAKQLPGSPSASVVDALMAGKPPVAPGAGAVDPAIQAAVEAVESQRPEAEILARVGEVSEGTLDRALVAARQQVMAFDDASKPVNDGIDRYEASLAGAEKGLRRDVAFARIRYNAARYDAEARLNQAVANLLELQVRKANLSAERHHRRSGQFFFGMLGAQAAVIIATFAIAAQKRNFLWTVAAAAGLAAVVFAIYVYLKV